MGMTGIDEEFALLKMVRAHLCVKWKTTHANNSIEDLKAFAREQLAKLIVPQQTMAYAMA